MSAVLTESSPTALLTRFAAELRAEDVPADVLHQGKRVLLDAVGCALGGMGTPMAQANRLWIEAMGGHPHATVIGSGRTSVAQAACANARMVTALDADETYSSIRYTSHHAASTVASALAVGEMTSASGRDVLVAAIAGYEIGARLALALVPAGPGHESGPRSPWGAYSPSGVIGSSLAAARAMRLPSEVAVHAIGIAGMHVDAANYKLAEVGHAPMIKGADCGWHALTGVLAAVFAANGVTGYPTILDGESGLWRALGFVDCDWDQLTGGLGDTWHIQDAAFKAWPCTFWMHQTLTALQEVLNANEIAPGEIQRIVLRTNTRSSAARFRERHPQQELGYAHSLPHTSAMIALKVPVGPRWFDPQTRDSAAVRRLRDLVEIELEPADAPPPEASSDLLVRGLPGSAEVWARGTSFQARAELGLGAPWREETRLSDEDLAAKFRGMAAPAATDTGWVAPADAVIETIMAIEELDEVGGLMRMLAPG